MNFRRIFARGRNAEEGSVQLSFSIEKIEEGEAVEHIGTAVPRDIIRLKNSFIYAIMRGIEPDAEKLRIAGRAKWHVIEQLSNSEEYNNYELAAKIALQHIPLPEEDAHLLARIVAYDTAGNGPFDLLMEDKSSIEEIEVNAPTAPISIYHTKYGRCMTNIRFNSEGELRRKLNKMIYENDKELNEESPIIDAQVGDLRVHAQSPPYSLNGTVAAIRLGGKKEIDLAYIARSGTASFHTLAYLWLAIDADMNMVISGPPASGKTTLMASLLSFVPRQQRTIVIEDNANELHSYQNAANFVSLYGSRVSRVTSAEQVVNALRMRPDRIVVGELRGSEARELFAGANLGVPFITTMHSNDGELGIIKRLLLKPMSVEQNAISALDLSIYMNQIDIRKRIISQIYEYKWLSRAEILEQHTNIGDEESVEALKVLYNGVLDKKALNNSKVIGRYAEREGISKTQALKELEKRTTYLKELFSTEKSTLDIISEIQNYGVLS